MQSQYGNIVYTIGFLKKVVSYKIGQAEDSHKDYLDFRKL